MVLSCIDPRFQKPVHKHLKDKKLTGKFSAFTIAGGSIGVTNDKFKKWHSTFWENLETSINLHKINKLIVLNHNDCGAAKIVNKLLYISGQISMDENGKLIKGKVGQDLNTDQAYKAAERCALNIAAQAKKACNNDLSKIKSCIKLTGFVNSTDEFTEQPKVINGASDTIAKIFGDSGIHTRAAVSTNSLPLGVAVEVDAIFELK